MHTIMDVTMIIGIGVIIFGLVIIIKELIYACKEHKEINENEEGW